MKLDFSPRLNKTQLFSDDSDEDDEYLLEAPKKKQKLMPMGDNKPAETVEDMQERADVIKQKFEQRKLTKKSSNKSDRRKLRQEKLLKKQQTLNRKKAMTNELLKQERVGKKVKVKEDPEDQEQKPEIKKSSVYNPEGKLFFSKIQVEGEKKKKKGHDTNPQLNLQKLKAQKKKIQELAESGDKVKAKEEKVKVLWKAAFEKTEGVKVKDNADILKKTIKKRKVEKKKSKQEWGQRKLKVKEKQEAKSKKREDNINKRKTDNQKNKKKKAIKRDRILQTN